MRTSIGRANIVSINSCTLSRVKRVSSSSSFNFVSSSTPQSNAVNRARSYLKVEAVMMALAREEARGREGGGGKGGLLQVVALGRLKHFAA